MVRQIKHFPWLAGPREAALGHQSDAGTSPVLGRRETFAFVEDVFLKK